MRVYLPPDANTLLSVADHCLRSRDYVNVIVAGKQPAPQLARRSTRPPSTARGASASGSGPVNDEGGEPDIVMACAGDVPTLETLAAVDILRERASRLRVRVVNVVDLMKLQPRERAPARPLRRRVRRDVHDRQAGGLRLPRLPVAHPPPHLPAHNHHNIHVRGYKEEGTTTTPFDMVVLNDLDRYHLVMDVIDRVPSPARARRRRPSGDGRRDEVARAGTRARWAPTSPRSRAGRGPPAP